MILVYKGAKKRESKDFNKSKKLSILNDTVVGLIFIVTMMNVVISAFVGGEGGPTAKNLLLNETITPIPNTIL